MASTLQEFSAVYLLPLSELPTAVQDENSGNMFRHETKIRAYNIKADARVIHEKGGVVISLKNTESQWPCFKLCPKTISANCCRR